MGMIITRSHLEDDLQRLFDALEDRPAVFHTDLRGIGIVERVKPRDEALEDYWTAIHTACGQRPLLFATFNYDFCREGVYDVRRDPCQVGVLNEYVRRLHPSRRTHTPVFNFCAVNDGGFASEPWDEPLSARSTFGEMVLRGAEVVLLGTDLSADTLFHHIEEVVDVGYRYAKTFTGVIRDGETEREQSVRYKVRPRVDGEMVEIAYEWPRLMADVLEAGIFRRLPMGNGWCYHHRADRLMEHWSERLTQDELYLLTPETRRRVEELYRRFGSPLHGAVVEEGAPAVTSPETRR